AILRFVANKIDRAVELCETSIVLTRYLRTREFDLRIVGRDGQRNGSRCRVRGVIVFSNVYRRVRRVGCRRLYLVRRRVFAGDKKKREGNKCKRNLDHSDLLVRFIFEYSKRLPHKCANRSHNPKSLTINRKSSSIRGTQFTNTLVIPPSRLNAFVTSFDTNMVKKI